MTANVIQLSFTQILLLLLRTLDNNQLHYWLSITMKDASQITPSTCWQGPINSRLGNLIVGNALVSQTVQLDSSISCNGTSVST